VQTAVSGASSISCQAVLVFLTRILEIQVRTRHFVINLPAGVEYHATMESCSDEFHVDIPNVA
jgi:hypothetical protein